MSRQQSHMNRGKSYHEGAKTKPKKVGQENEQKNDSNHLQLSEAYNRNIQRLEKITQYLISQSKRNNREADVSLLEYIVADLARMKNFAMYERTQNCQKVNTYKNKMDNVPLKKDQKIRKSQRLQLLQSVSSPIYTKGLIIGRQQSPTNSPTLIERKIAEEENQKTSFQSIKNKDLCLNRIFQLFDRIADKLNLFKGQRHIIPFRKVIASIQASVENLINNEDKTKNAFRDIQRQQSEISRMKNQIVLLKFQNSNLQSELIRLKTDLEESLILREQRQAQCESLNKECELITKEKLDLETLLSQESKRHKDFRKFFQKKARKVKDCLRDGKWLQSQLKQAVKEHRNSLECFSREAFNELICAYTQELFNSSTKRKREVAALEAEMEIIEQNYEAKTKIRDEEDKNKQIQRIGKLKLVSMDIQQIQLHAQKARKEFSIFQLQDIAFTGKSKNIIFVQTEQEEPYQLGIQHSVIQVTIKKTRKKLQIYSGTLLFIKDMRYSCEEATQTETQNRPTMLNDSQAETQTETDRIHTSIQTCKKSFIFLQTLDIVISPKLVQTIDVFTTTPINFDIVKTIDQNLSYLKQTEKNSTNTQQNVSIYHDNCAIMKEQFESSAKKMEPFTEDSILNFLLEAEECTIIPQICLLRSQINVYRSQIQHLNKLVISLKSERKREEDETVFQFCY